jgi:transcriptional regulator with XRE-family HTH domain
MRLPERREVKTELPQEISAQERWVQMRRTAGFRSDRALERALGIAEKQIWRWVHLGREPNLATLRQLKQLLGVSLDTLDETIVSMRSEAASQADTRRR